MSDEGTPHPPAGWYPDPTQAGQQRYWDGTQWTDHTAPGGGGTSASEATGAGERAGGAVTAGRGYGTTGATTGSKPDPWLWQSIVATILCCNVLGVVGVVYGAQAQAAIDYGDLETARHKAGRARLFTLIAAGVFLVLIVLYIAFFAAMAGGGNFSEFR